MFAQILIVAGAALTTLLGILHLQGSFFLFDKDLEPHDDALKEHMKRSSLKISPATNVWRAWIGFNAQFALGLLLFGLSFGYLGLFKFAALTQMPFLLLVGSLYLIGLTLLSLRLLFHLPALAFALCFILHTVGSGAALLYPPA